MAEVRARPGQGTSRKPSSMLSYDSERRKCPSLMSSHGWLGWPLTGGVSRWLGCGGWNALAAFFLWPGVPPTHFTPTYSGAYDLLFFW